MKYSFFKILWVVFSGVVTIYGFITFHGHDYFNVTGEKQPEYPHNLLMWMFLVLKVVFWSGVGYMVYVLASVKRNLDVLTSQYALLNEEKASKSDILRVEQEISSIKRMILALVAHSDLRMQQLRKVAGGSEYEDAKIMVNEYISLKEFLLDHYKFETNELERILKIIFSEDVIEFGKNVNKQIR